MQSPGGPEEDPRNGFTHGGWAMRFLDDAGGKAIGEIMTGECDMLLGRRTYEIFPLVLGEGKRLFENGVPPRVLSLVATTSTPSGVLLNTYRLLGPL